jgi:ParB family chromosome partitioning protein
VRATEEAVAMALGGEPTRTPAPAKRRPKPHSPALAELADRLSDRFDTRVKVDLGRSKGKITIEFATVDDLERIVELIGVDRQDQSLRD